MYRDHRPRRALLPAILIPTVLALCATAIHAQPPDYCGVWQGDGDDPPLSLVGIISGDPGPLNCQNDEVRAGLEYWAREGLDATGPRVPAIKGRAACAFREIKYAQIDKCLGINRVPSLTAMRDRFCLIPFNDSDTEPVEGQHDDMRWLAYFQRNFGPGDAEGPAVRPTRNSRGLWRHIADVANATLASGETCDDFNIIARKALRRFAYDQVRIFSYRSEADQDVLVAMEAIAAREGGLGTCEEAPTGNTPCPSCPSCPPCVDPPIDPPGGLVEIARMPGVFHTATEDSPYLADSYEWDSPISVLVIEFTVKIGSYPAHHDGKRAAYLLGWFYYDRWPTTAAYFQLTKDGSQAKILSKLGAPRGEEWTDKKRLRPILAPGLYRVRIEVDAAGVQGSIEGNGRSYTTYAQTPNAGPIALAGIKAQFGHLPAGANQGPETPVSDWSWSDLLIEGER